MTPDILQSDIDLARKLLDERRPETEIVAALAYRGIESGRATQLIAELQAGKKVEPDRPIQIKLPPKSVEISGPSGPDSTSGRRTHSPAKRSKHPRTKQKT